MLDDLTIDLMQNEALKYLKEHKDDAIRIGVSLLIGVVMTAFILAFRGGNLPHSSDGDAFDTIYALEQSGSAS